MSRISTKLANMLSLRIIGIENGKLTFYDDAFNKFLCETESDTSSHNGIPVTLLSIFGAISEKKDLVRNAFLEYYENGMKRNSNTFQLTPPTTTTVESEASGVYLITKWSSLRLDIDYPDFVWVLNIFPTGDENELKLLQRFSLLASSRIADVKFDDQFQMIKHWMYVAATFEKSQRSQLCNNFVCAVTESSGQRPQHKLPLLTLTEIRETCYFGTENKAEDNSAEQVLYLNMLEMISAKPTLDGDSPYHSLIKSIRELHRVSKLPLKHDKVGNQLMLDGLSKFIQDCVHLANHIQVPPIQHATVYERFTPKSWNWTTPEWISRNLASFPKSFDNIRSALAYQRTSHTTKNDVDSGKDLQTERASDAIPEIKSDEELAAQLIPEVVKFYDEEMSRFLSEDVYTSQGLGKIHDRLTHQLSQESGKTFREIFNLSESTLKKLENVLKATLGKKLAGYLQKNIANLKTKQKAVQSCIQQLLGSYMGQIESILLANPNGLIEKDLEDKHHRIVNKIEVDLIYAIPRIREEELTVWHLQALLSGIGEYWKGVLERNRESLNNLPGLENPVVLAGEFQEVELVEGRQLSEVELVQEAKPRCNPGISGNQGDGDLTGIKIKLKEELEKIRMERERGQFMFRSKLEEGRFDKRMEEFERMADSRSTAEELKVQIKKTKMWIAEYKK